MSGVVKFEMSMTPLLVSVLVLLELLISDGAARIAGGAGGAGTVSGTLSYEASELQKKAGLWLNTIGRQTTYCCAHSSDLRMKAVQQVDVWEPPTCEKKHQYVARNKT